MPGPQREILEYTAPLIQEDLESFADRGSVIVDVAPDAQGRGELNAVWEQGGKVYPGDHHFRLANGSVEYVEGDNAPIPYAHFLRQVSELDPIGRAMATAGKLPKYYVPTKSRISDKDELENSDKMLLREIGAHLDEDQFKTQVFFVKGDAGAGKTTLLERLTAVQAQKFTEGSADFLFFYVSAQGRALSNLDEAIAKELDDLRAIFSHRLRGDGMLTLVRNKLLVPIVDGFDELLGTQGYTDAFSSLRNFLNRLKGAGAMVVSARSAFYAAEFVQRAQMSMGNQLDGARFEVVPVSLLEWEEPELLEFLTLCRGKKEVAPKDLRQLKALPSQDRALLKKPFFAAEFPKYVDEDNPKEFLQYLADAYIKRESKKIVGTDQLPFLPPEHHERIFINIAELMWEDKENRRSVGRGDLQAAVELILGELGVDSDKIAQLRVKIISAAGLRVGNSEGEGRTRFSFEHEVYFEHFLSQLIRGKLLEGTLIEKRSSPLDIRIFPVGAVRLAIQDVETAKACLQLVNQISDKAKLPDNNRAINLGQMLAASFALLGEKNITCDKISARGLVFRDCSFGTAQLSNVHFLDCIFSEVDLSDCSLIECVATKSRAEGPLILSNNTRFDITGFTAGEHILAINYPDEKSGKKEEIWEPNRIAEIIGQLGGNPQEVSVPTYSDKARTLIELMRRVAGAFRTASTLCEEDTKLRRIFADPEWKTLREILIDHAMIVEDERATGHASKERMFLRKAVNSMDEVMSHENTSDSKLPQGKIGDFWRKLRKMK